MEKYYTIIGDRYNKANKEYCKKQGVFAYDLREDDADLLVIQNFALVNHVGTILLNFPLLKDKKEEYLPGDWLDDCEENYYYFEPIINNIKEEQIINEDVSFVSNIDKYPTSNWNKLSLFKSKDKYSVLREALDRLDEMDKKIIK